MRSIIFIAPPAGGKGTFSDIICSKYNMPHISTGDLLREAASSSSDMSSYIREQMKLGNLIKDEIIFDLIKERIAREDCNNGYVLDGFPRNIAQADAYNDILKELNKDLGCVILLNIPKEVAAKRIAGRISCPNCGKVYNIYNEEMKPKKENMCDNCNIPLTKREDDNEETYNVRYNTYIEKTQPLIDYYKNKKVLFEIDSTLPINEVVSKIEEIIRGD